MNRASSHRRNLFITILLMLAVILASYVQNVFAAPLVSLPRDDLHVLPPDATGSPAPTLTATLPNSVAGQISLSQANLDQIDLEQAAVSFNPSAITVTRGGAAVTANLTVQNTGTTTETFTLALSSIPGLVVTSSSNQLNNVAPGASAQVIVTITAGANATLGTQQLLATITQTRDSSTFTGALAITVNDPPAPSLRIELRSGERVRDAAQGSVTTYQLRVVNAGSVRTTFNLAFDPNVRCSVDTVGCTQSFSGQTQGITLDPNAGFDFDVSIRLPTDARVGNTSITRVVAQVGANDVAALLLELRITAAPTNTPTETPTETPTLTPSPTPTLGPICVDNFEPDNSRSSAKLILVNLPQPQDPIRIENRDRRAICPSGDEDWLFFGGVAGKVYTIDVRDVAPGLDLSLELFDKNGQRIAFNDDFFPREPSINPRIQSWRAPTTDIYYIRVRDTVGNGGTNLTYRIELIDESFGPTPQTVEEICLDLFEPDGLSEQAKLITSNERQLDRRLCPTGDADWVVFFGKAGKRYFIYTDTRPYFQNNPVNPSVNVQAGADTILTLVDRDGVTILDVNDDIPGGETLDSQVEFVPETDGFYYVQVKNVGDIGNQFIRYDLTLQLCVPGQEDCGRLFRLPATPTSVPPEPTPTLTEEFDLDEEATPTPEE